MSSKYLHVLRLITKLAAARYSPHPVPLQPRVLHITPQYFSDESAIGGGERFPLELARAMGELVPTSLVSFGKRRQTHNYGAAKIEIYPLLRWRSTANNPLGLTFLKELLRADVVHCHQFHYPLMVMTILAAAVLGKPVFVTDLGGRTTSLSDRLELHRLVCLFLNLTKFEEAWTKSEGQSAIIYGGVDTNHFSQSLPPQPRVHALFVGRLLPHKGIDMAIRAVGQDIPLVVVGRPYDDRYYQDLQELARDRKVTFITNADDRQLLQLYRSALAIILPSVYTDMYGTQHENAEFLGLTLLEGMACGTPAICTAVGGMPEIVDHMVTGFVVPPGDVDLLRTYLLQLHNNPEIVSAIGERAVKQVQDNYTWEKVAERCLAAYRLC